MERRQAAVTASYALEKVRQTSEDADFLPLSVPRRCIPERRAAETKYMTAG